MKEIPDALLLTVCYQLTSHYLFLIFLLNYLFIIFAKTDRCSFYQFRTELQIWHSFW